MSGHTPGPWWASTNGLEVGTVPMMDIKVAKVSGANYEEAKANAKLIATAPDLVEALEKLLVVSGDRLSIMENHYINDLIAKAKGAQ